MRKLTYLILFFSSLAFSQVGVNNEDPTSDFEVKGIMRLRRFDANVTPSRVLLANDKGDVGFVPQRENSYTSRDVYYTMRPMDLITPFRPPYNGSCDVKLTLTVEVNPYSETAIVLDYNIPITAIIGRLGGYPVYFSIGLQRKEVGNGKLIGLQDGSRKVSLYPSNAYYGGSNFFSIPLSGKALDIIKNDTSEKITFIYSIMGDVSASDTIGGEVHFGNLNKNETAYGTGIFIAQVYERKL